MLELSFSATDLANTRFAISPLWEVVASSLVLRGPSIDPMHRPWVEQVDPRLRAAGVDLRPLADVVPSWREIPVFVTQPPPVAYPTLTLELAAVRTAEEASDELLETIEAYWSIALEPYWPRIRRTLESDILHRAGRIAAGGAAGVLNDLDPRISWEGETLSVAHRHVSRSLRLDGRGLLLAPSVFAWPNVYSISIPPWQPTLRYPPRGIGLLWHRRPTSVPDALAAVLGRTRARLLGELDTPTATATLAARTGLSAGGVSEHLTALRDAGLVSAHRSGRYVLYARTEVAETWLARARD